MSNEDAENAEPLAVEGQHIAPAVDRGAFQCPYCGVLCKQDWKQLGGTDRAKKSRCTNCWEDAFWLDYREIGTPSPPRWVMTMPFLGGGPRPHPLMPDESKADYVEAQSIVNLSPRGACALLRLGVEKLAAHLEPGDYRLNDRIGRMVANGLPELIQQALDALRVIGNNAVHPGELDLRDDKETAVALFEVMNLIVEDRIAQPNKMSRLYQKLPQKAREAIEKRDAPRELPAGEQL